MAVTWRNKKITRFPYTSSILCKVCTFEIKSATCRMPNKSLLKLYEKPHRGGDS